MLHQDGWLEFNSTFNKFFGAKLQATNRVPRPVDRGTS